MANKTPSFSLVQIIMHSIVRIFSSCFLCVIYRVRSYGMKNVPKTGPTLILCNHQSFFDPMFSQSWVYRSFCFVARDSLFEGKFGKLLYHLYAIPIRRGQADVAAMRSIIAYVKAGYAVCLYPEATRTHDGRIADIKAGFGLLVRRSKATVVPVVIDGAFECWPRTRKFPKLGKIRVVYGEPITPDQIAGLDNETFAAMVTRRMRTMQDECRIKAGKEPFKYSTTETKGDTQ